MSESEEEWWEHRARRKDPRLASPSPPAAGRWIIKLLRWATLLVPCYWMSQLPSRSSRVSAIITGGARTEQVLAACPNVLEVNRRVPRQRVDERYNETEAPHIGVLVIPEYRMLVCTLPRNGAVLLRALAARLRADPRAEFTLEQQRALLAHIEFDELRMHSLDEIESMASDPSWFKMLV